MRLFLISLILFFGTFSLAAQDAYLDKLFEELSSTYGITGGNLILADSEQKNIDATITYGNITARIDNSTDTPFTKYHSIKVNGEGTNPWDAGLNQTNENVVNRNDNVLVAFWIRGTSDAIAPKVNFFVENAANYDKEMLLTIELSQEWTQYLIPYSSLGSYNKDQITVGLHLAYGVQEVEFAGITLINYEDNYTLQDLPNKQGSGPYEGYEDDAPWRAEAAARIDKYRKADMRILLTDLNGNPLKNRNVNVKMKQHEFEFGTAVNTSLFAGNRNQLSIYEDKLLNIDGQGNGFNTVVFENSLKWRAWEGEWPTNKSEKIDALNWLTENNITTRGHNILWPGWDVLPDYMESNKNNPSFLVDNIRARVNSMLTNPDIANNIRDWDVINEIAAVRDIEDALKGTSGYETGREIYAEVFKQVKEVDPGITTYLNDYITIGSNRDDGVLYNEYKKFIQEIIDGGGEIDGIGFQAHIGGSPTAPVKVYNILEDFYSSFGTDAKITEYDTDRLVSGDLGAKYMEDFLTIIFSHVSVKGFLMWGFWDGAHWKQNAPIFNMDWTMKPSGEAFIKKVYNDWWVNENVQTDGEGYLELRGFKGDYEITPLDLDEKKGFLLSSDTTATIQFNTTVSTTEVDFETQFNLYPNPTENYLNISNRGNQSFSYEVIDQVGRILLQGEQSKKHQLSIAALTPGNYYVRISMNGNSFVKKIFKN